MPRYEYRVIAAPTKGQKAKGLKRPEAWFAHGVEIVLNKMAAHGWEFQRAETLPSEERAGLTSTHTVYRNVLVFRRTVAETPALAQLPAPDAAEDARFEDGAPARLDEPAALAGAVVDSPDDAADADNVIHIDTTAEPSDKKD